jgi:cell division protein FtsQ
VDTKRTIRKILFITLWVVIGGGMITLLLAAIGRKKKEICNNYEITIKGAQNNFFIDKKSISKLLAAACGGEIKGQHLTEIKMRKLEELLEDNEWVQNAEIWFDNKNILKVIVTEREPIARIFTTAGRSFYIDSTTKKMSLSDKMSARVPVFTGFPEKKLWTGNDSALAHDIKTISLFIQQNSFWNSQVSQVDIINCGFNCWQFEMVPLVGNHTVRLGNADNIEEKFDRLFTFYKQVLSKTGFDKYPVLDVQFNGQIIGVKEKSASKIDSIQLRRNVEKLLQQSRAAQYDSIGAINPPRNYTPAAPDSTADENNRTTTTPDMNKRPVPVKTTNPTTKPKAVMKKKRG